MFLVGEEENSRCPSFSPLLLFISKGHELKAYGISYFQLRSWSHAVRAAIGQIFENNFCQSVQKHWRERGREKKKGNSKAFCVTRKHKKRRKFKTILFWYEEVAGRWMEKKNVLMLNYLWKKLSRKLFQCTEKSFPCFFYSYFFCFFNFVPQQSLNFSFYVSFCEINCIKIQAMSQSSSKSILAEILCVLFTLTSSFVSDWKKKLVFSRTNEIKTYGLVQHLILGILRDLILQ